MVRIYTAAHNEYTMPDDAVYVPVMAGAELWTGAGRSIPDGWMRDDDGENISARNRDYCELTVLYWLWRNPDKSDSSHIGICHYRRFFMSPSIHSGSRSVLRTFRRIRSAACTCWRGEACDNSWNGAQHLSLSHEEGREDHLLTEREAQSLLRGCDIILPRARNYVIDTNYTQFANSHGSAGLDAARQVIAEHHPEYLQAFDRRMKMRTGHRFNMFIMSRTLINEYCEWLFSILAGIGSLLATDTYAASQQADRADAASPLYAPAQTVKATAPRRSAQRCSQELPTGTDQIPCRLYGYIAERLLDVWIDARGLRTVDVPYLFIGREHLLAKAASLIMRKLRAYRYS